MKLGAADYLTKPFNIDEVKIVINNIVEKKSLKSEVSYLRRFYSEAFRKDIIGESPAMRELKHKAEKVALSNVSTVLITGESGTGKELVARYIHSIMYDESKKGFAPFIAINCTALPETLLESELFGYEKGAFTDAKAHKEGKFELANGGTLFLDEITNLSDSNQMKLLRVLEERKITRLGGKKARELDVRIIGASNVNLSIAVGNNSFRTDLFYRLNEFHIDLPPLRERREDIGIFIDLFIKDANKELGKNVKSVSGEVTAALMKHNWPGNIRELRNTIRRAVLLANDSIINSVYINELVPPAPFSNDGNSTSFADSSKKAEREIILKAIDEAGGNKSKAAKILNMNERTFYRKIKSLGIQ
jgi:DNA-binding NtrC family response regulator